MDKSFRLINVNSYINKKYVDFIDEPLEIISRHSIVLDKPPAEWIDGMHLGNGDLGAMVYGPVENLTYCLSKADLWDLRYNKDRSGFNFEQLKKILETEDKKAYNKYRDYYSALNPRSYPSPQPACVL